MSALALALMTLWAVALALLTSLVVTVICSTVINETNSDFTGPMLRPRAGTKKTTLTSDGVKRRTHLRQQ